MPNEVKIKASLENKVSGPLNDIRKAMDKGLGKGSSASFFGNVGAKAVAGGFGLIDSAIHGAIGIVGGWVEASSNLNEETSKSGVIFGKNAKDIEKWAEGSAKAIGLSTRAALEASSGFAGLFQTVGLGLDKSTDMSKKIVTLGSDLASFFNTDMQTALDALKSGLSGESEPLRRFNIFLSETAVSSKLAQMGVKKVGGQFTESQKATARYALIMEQASAANGDFTRTSGGLANQQRILAAEVENANAELGERFLPLQLKITQAQRDSIPVVEGVVDALGNMGTGLEFIVNTSIDVQNALSFWDPAERSGAAVKGLSENFTSSFKSIKKDTQDAGEGVRADVDWTGTRLDHLGNRAKALQDRIESVNDFIVTDIAKSRKEITDAAQGFADAAYDPLIAKMELAATQRDAIETRAAIKSGKLKGQELAEAKLHLVELAKTETEQLGILASYGDAVAINALQNKVDVLRATKGLSQDEIAWLHKLEQELKDARKAALALNNALSHGHNQGGDPDRGRATGGPVWPGVWTVGEKGPETLVLGGGGQGYVIPGAGQTGGGAARAPVTRIINVMLPGVGIVATAIDDENYWRGAGAGGSTLRG